MVVTQSPTDWEKFACYVTSANTSRLTVQKRKIDWRWVFLTLCYCSSEKKVGTRVVCSILQHTYPAEVCMFVTNNLKNDNFLSIILFLWAQSCYSLWLLSNQSAHEFIGVCGKVNHIKICSNNQTVTFSIAKMLLFKDITSFSSSRSVLQRPF